MQNQTSPDGEERLVGYLFLLAIAIFGAIQVAILIVLPEPWPPVIYVVEAAAIGLPKLWSFIRGLIRQKKS